MIVSPTRAPVSMCDAELDDGLDLAGDQRARKPVLGNSEHHHPAEPFLRLVHRHRMTGQAQVARRREPGRAPADDPDVLEGCRGDIAVRRGATSSSRRSSRLRTVRSRIA